jgi:hypothetical protein
MKLGHTFIFGSLVIVLAAVVAWVFWVATNQPDPLMMTAPVP